jgi:hypothetical protein
MLCTDYSSSQHTVDVSWAVVQRSQGFMDGADRLALLEAQSTAQSQTISQSCTPQVPLPPLPPSKHSCVLLISNLSALLFSNVSDLYPLVCPYGDVKNLKLLDISRSKGNHAVSAVVEYHCGSSAEDAFHCLNQQTYADQTIQVDYLLGPPNSTVPTFVSTASVSSAAIPPASQSCFQSVISFCLPQDQIPSAAPTMPSDSWMNHMPVFLPQYFPPCHNIGQLSAAPPMHTQSLSYSPCVFWNSVNIQSPIMPVGPPGIEIQLAQRPKFVL